MGKTRGVWHYLLEATRKNRLAMVALILMEVLLSLSTFASVLSMRTALDGAVQQDVTALGRGLIGMTFFILLRMADRALIRFLDEAARSSIENELKGRLLHHLLHNNYGQIKAVHTGEWMNRLTSDTTVVANGLTEILPSFCGMVVKLVGAAAMIVLMVPRVTYFLFPAGIFAICITWQLRKKMKQHHNAVQERDGLLRIFLQERLGNMMIVRAFQGENAVEGESLHRMEQHKRARMRRNMVSNLCNIGFAGLMNGLYMICFAYCSYGIVVGRISYGTLMAVIQLVGQIQTPFAGLSGILPRFYSMTASAERLMEAEGFDAEPAAAPLPKGDFSELVLDQVSFAYPDDAEQMVFSDVSLRFRKGDHVALIGHSGYGKSTLFKLLLCLYRPTAGRLSVRFADGTEAELSTAHRPLFAYVPQGNQLMSGTIREIVTFSEKDHGDVRKVYRALQIACADTFVAELEQGIETVLGEHGAGLSEGQMQRIAIARAIYADAPIILLDEATSSLDAQTERQVLENLKSMTDKTVLLITHRPAALEICERMIEVTDGSICEANP